MRPASFFGVALAASLASTSSAVWAQPSGRHVDVAASSVFLLASCACDGYGILDDHFGVGARVGYRAHPLPWLGLGVAPSLHVHARSRSVLFPLTVAPTWSLGGENALWLLAGGGFAHFSGRLQAAGQSNAQYRQSSLFGQLGAGGAVALGNRLSLFGELVVLAGRGTIGADEAYPGGYIDGQRGTYIGAGLDVGVRWGL